MHNICQDQLFFLLSGEGGSGRVEAHDRHREANVTRAWWFDVFFFFRSSVFQDKNPGAEMSEGSSALDSDISVPLRNLKKNKRKNKCYVCLSVRSVPTYYVNEVDRCCRVQVPVQLVQNDPLHAKNLRRREVAAALHHEVFDGAYYLFKHTDKKGNK